MAGPWFVRSGAAGAGTGADWANAFTTLTAANTASTAGGGETFWIADDHAESTAAAVTLTSKGTAANPNFYYCVDHTKASPGPGDIVSVPTGQITTTGNSNIVFNGIGYYQGLIFNCGTGAVAALINVNAIEVIFKTCSLRKLGTTGTNSAITVNCNLAILDNVSIQIGATADKINLVGTGIWKNTPNAILGATFPSTLFFTGSTLWTIDGVDLSALAGGQTIAGVGANVKFAAKSLKLGAGAVLCTTPAVPGSIYDFIQCDSGATNYFQSRFAYQGTLTQETTIVRSGGASDGTTPISHKIVTTANSKWVSPFESFPVAIWNDAVGSPVTATVEIVSAGALNNDDVWLEVEYLGDVGSPQASFANSTKANNLATGTALPVSTATWASSPGAPQQLAVAFTPQMNGYIYARVYIAKASQTLYADPLITLS